MEIEKNKEKLCSCKINITKKCEWSGELKGYAVDLDTAMINTVKKAEELESLIRVKNGG